MKIVGALMIAGMMLVAQPSLLLAQGSIRGTVVRSTTGAGVPGAEIEVMGSARVTLSDSVGAFAIADLEPGWYVLQTRKLGFVQRRDTVNVRDARVTQVNFSLQSQASLDTVHTMAARAVYRSPALRAFEERRLSQTSGYFIPEAELRQSDDKSLTGIILQKAPGVRIDQTRGSTQTLVGTRTTCAGPVFQRTKNSCVPCYVTVYLDGQLVYSVNPTRDQGKNDFENRAFDLGRVQVNELAGVEFYPTSATAPAEYNATAGGCGVLLLWTREH
jgi:hypothetical protein